MAGLSFRCTKRYVNVDRPLTLLLSRPLSIVKFVLLHDIRNEEGIRLFFMDVWESYVKVRCPPV